LRRVKLVIATNKSSSAIDGVDAIALPLHVVFGT